MTPSDTAPPFWLRPPAIALFVAAITLVRFAVAGQTGLVRDEAYYALWSTQPGWGYLDHPPMIGWLVALGRLASESEAGVRLLPVIGTALTSFAIWRSGKVLFGEKTAGLAVIWFNLTVGMGLLFLATPDTPVVTFWALSVWAVAEFMARGNARWWLAAGLFAGLAVLSKYTGLFLGLGYLLLIATSRARWRWLGLWQLWAGGAIALAVMAPNLIWNARNGWASFAFQGQRLDGRGLDLGSAPANFGDLIAGQALALGLFLFVLIGVGIVAFALRRDLPERANLALPIFTGLPILLWFALYTLRFRAEANWPLPAWPMLSLAGAWAAVHVRPRHLAAALPLGLLRWAQAPIGLLLVGLIYAQALWQPFSLPQAIDRTRDMRGWTGLEQEVAALAQTGAAQWIAVGPGDYGLAGELATHGSWAGTALPVTGVNEPERWRHVRSRYPALAVGPGLFVVTGTGRQALAARYFGVAELVGEARRMQGDEVLERFEVYAVREPLAGTRAVLGGS